MKQEIEFDYKKRFQNLVALALIELDRHPGLIKYSVFQELKKYCDEITNSTGSYTLRKIDKKEIN